MSADTEHWQVRVAMHQKMATCTARKADRKYTLVYFFNKHKFIFTNRASNLGSPLKQVPADAEEIKRACLTALAVQRMTQ